MEKSESILIKMLQEGSEEAFRQLVEQFQNRVFNTCYGFVNNRDDADDISQEVFVEIYYSIKYFKETSSLATWIYRISVNKSLDFLRHNKRQKRWAELFRLSSAKNESTDHWFVDTETPQIQLENEEKRKILYLAIESLPENQRTAFTLQKIEDLSYQEVAEIMQTTVTAVESLLHRAKTNLRNRLEKYYLNEKKT